MPPNVANQPKPDAFDSLIRRYLTVDGVLHTEAYEVTMRWYVYLNALANSVGNQITPQDKLGIDVVELAFETPIAGFGANVFWQQYGAGILPLVQRDMVTNHVLLRLSEEASDLVVAMNVVGQFSFIGCVVSLVQRDGLASWKAFEVEFRAFMAKTSEAYLNGDRR